MTTDYSFHTALSDGTPVWIRMVRAEDKTALSVGYEKLSPESRYGRFFTAPHKLSNNQLKYLTEIDNVNHLGLLAIDTTKEGEHGIAVGRYVRLTCDPSVAEVAITILDAYQRKGLGKILFSQLAKLAVQNGISGFVCYFLKSNDAAKGLLKNYNCSYYNEDPSVYRAEISLLELC